MPEPLDTALPYLADEVENDPIDTSVPEEEVSSDPAPEQDVPEGTDAPPPPPQNDLNAQITQLIAQQREAMTYQQQQAEEQRRMAALQQQADSRPRPLAEQPEWMARYVDASSRAAYDEDAARTLAALNRDLAAEQAQQMMGPLQEQLRLEMRSGEVIRQAAQISSQYGNAFTEADYLQTATEIFGNDRANLSRVLDPALNQEAEHVRRLLADATVGRQLREGRLSRPAAPTPPPNPRAAARTSAPGKPAPTSTDMWADTSYVDGVMADMLDMRSRR